MSADVIEIAEAAGLEQLLAYLRDRRGFDFSGYKRPSLERRIAKRMKVVGAETYGEYVDFLEVNPEELARLFDTILIQVTRFFRDPAAWEHLAGAVVPRITAAKSDPGAQIRVWSAGCASGEEAYTIAMTLAEALGDEEYKRRVKIYATDVDGDSLDRARLATFTPKQLDGVSADRLARFFEPADDDFAFRKDLRRNVIFGRNDLVQDAPISRIDLLVCRNTLMYFNAETQGRILRRFHFALARPGFLFLGKSEMLVAHADRFAPLEKGKRVFARLSPEPLRPRDGRMATSAAVLAASLDGAADGALDGAGDGGLDGAADGALDGRGGGAGLLKSAYDASPVAQVLIEAGGSLVSANQHARERFGISEFDAGRPLQELGLWTRPVELRAHLAEAYGERHPVTLAGVAYDRPGHEGVFDIRITPLLAGDAVRGASITLTDVTLQHDLRRELERSKHGLEHAYEELQSVVEELETTNEELQSINEELETTNEELQSTNEELETTNEELQSTNEELETMNEELRARSQELAEVNAFLETIMTSMGVGVALIGRQLEIKAWNTRAEDLWGLRAAEVAGLNLLSLDIGLPVERLKTPVRAALAGQRESGRVELEATTRRGRAIVCAVTVLPLRLGTGEIAGAIILMEQREPADS